MLFGWCLRTFFHILGIIIPTDELIFFRGVGQPPTSYLSQILPIFWGKGVLRKKVPVNLRPCGSGYPTLAMYRHDDWKSAWWFRYVSLPINIASNHIASCGFIDDLHIKNLVGGFETWILFFHNIWDNPSH